jgi:hypothetical protein
MAAYTFVSLHQRRDKSCGTAGCKWMMTGERPDMTWITLTSGAMLIRGGLIAGDLLVAPRRRQ